MPNFQFDGPNLVPTLRYSAAAISAALSASAVAGITSGNLGIAYLAFCFALVHAVFLGIPAAVALHKRRRIGIFPALLAGFTVGSIPLGILTIADMAHTQRNWLDALMLVGSSGLFGVAGAIGGWLTWFASARSPWACVGSVAVVAALILSLPSITMDRSCHNVMRDGRSSIRPELVAEIRLDAADGPVLEKIIDDFARAKNWSFRGGSKTSLGNSACSEDGTQVHSWLVTPERGISIFIYQPQGGSSWQAPAHELFNIVEARWPGKLAITTGPDLLGPTPAIPKPKRFDHDKEPG